jgi:hypothetical protein
MLSRIAPSVLHSNMTHTTNLIFSAFVQLTSDSVVATKLVSKWGVDFRKFTDQNSVELFCVL